MVLVTGCVSSALSDDIAGIGMGDRVGMGDKVGVGCSQPDSRNVMMHINMSLFIVLL